MPFIVSMILLALIVAAVCGGSLFKCVCRRYSTFQQLPFSSVRHCPDIVCDKLTRQGTVQMQPSARPVYPRSWARLSLSARPVHP